MDPQIIVKAAWFDFMSNQFAQIAQLQARIKELEAALAAKDTKPSEEPLQ